MSDTAWAERRHVEIGWTWLTPGYRLIAAKIERSACLLRHGFESWDWSMSS